MFARTKVFDGEVMLLSGVATSGVIRQTHQTPKAVHFRAVGTSPNVKVEYTYSNDGISFSHADDETDMIGTGVVAGFTNNVQGWNAIAVTLKPADFYRFKVTNLNGSNGVTFDLKLRSEDLSY
jgi:hypothetical protein